MTREIISRKTRLELREYFVSTTLREIAQAFDAENVQCDSKHDPNLIGQRRSLVEQYYATIDWSNWTDVRRFVGVYENVLIELEGRSEGSDVWAVTQFSNLKKWLRKDGFDFAEGRIVSTAPVSAMPAVRHVATRFDLPELSRQIERMNSAVESDPSLAIGTAKELIETTCKSILDARGATIDPAAEIPQLIKETRKILKLLPTDIPDTARGAETIRKLLSNMGSIAQSVAELRNLYGTGHGRTGKSQGMKPRHARMVVGAAATLTTFLLETHEERD